MPAPLPPFVSRPINAIYAFLLNLFGYPTRYTGTADLSSLPGELVLGILNRLPLSDLQTAMESTTLLAYPGTEVFPELETGWQILSQEHLRPFRDKYFTDRNTFNYPISSPQGEYIQLLGKIQAIAALEELGIRNTKRREPAATLFEVFANSATYPDFTDKVKIGELKKNFDNFLLVLEYTLLRAQGTRFPDDITHEIVSTHFNTAPPTAETTAFWQYLDTELERINTEKLITVLSRINPTLPPNESNENKVTIFNDWIAEQNDKKLSLSWKNFSRAPKITGRLNAAESLDFSDNNILRLPDEIRNLSSLRKLVLSRNKLITLPAGIIGLTSLREFNVSSNQLSVLPARVYALSALVLLDLTGNKLTQLSARIGNLVKLEELKVGLNRLTSVPETIGNLINLVVLGLEGNRLNTLPKGLRNLLKLQVLKLSNNDIEQLPKIIGQLKELEKLLLEGNRLTKLPDEMQALTTLKVLDLARNRFKSLPSWVRDFKLTAPTGCEAITQPRQENSAGGNRQNPGSGQ